MASRTDSGSGPTPERLPALSSTGRGVDPSLDDVLKTLTGDVVMLGGYRGSILRDNTTPGPHKRQVWVSNLPFTVR
jgi:hypothetical protein